MSMIFVRVWAGWWVAGFCVFVLCVCLAVFLFGCVAVCVVVCSVCFCVCLCVLVCAALFVMRCRAGGVRLVAGVGAVGVG